MTNPAMPPPGALPPGGGPAQHGGYRQPSSPAPASGPGALSQRTDRGQPQRQVTGQPYGEAKAFLEQQTQAPMANDPGPIPGPQMRTATAGAGIQRQPPVPLNAPTQRPDEPVTAGAPIGAGPNVLPGPDASAAGYQSALGLVQQAAASSPEASALLQRLQQRM